MLEVRYSLTESSTTFRFQGDANKYPYSKVMLHEVLYSIFGRLEYVPMKTTQRDPWVLLQFDGAARRRTFRRCIRQLEGLLPRTLITP